MISFSAVLQHWTSLLKKNWSETWHTPLTLFSPFPTIADTPIPHSVKSLLQCSSFLPAVKTDTFQPVFRKVSCSDVTSDGHLEFITHATWSAFSYRLKLKAMTVTSGTEIEERRRKCLDRVRGSVSDRARECHWWRRWAAWGAGGGNAHCECTTNIRTPINTFDSQCSRCSISTAVLFATRSCVLTIFYTIDNVIK